jgi:hypothetical protein
MPISLYLSQPLLFWPRQRFLEFLHGALIYTIFEKLWLFYLLRYTYYLTLEGDVYVIALISRVSHQTVGLWRHSY